MKTNKHIVITGDKGFIGTYLKEALDKYHAEIKSDAICTLYDLKDGRDILDMTIPKADVIYHLAAQASVPESVKDPMYDAMTNIAGTIKILLENPEARVIIPGSVASKDPQSPYGLSKLAQEGYAHVIHTNAVVCRFPNVFADNDHGVMGHFINDTEIVVHGDGEQTRDFVHVDDIVKGLMRAEEWPVGSYELGSGTSHRIIDMANATGKKIVFEEARDGDIKYSTAENTTPDWKPKIDILEYIRSKS